MFPEVRVARRLSLYKVDLKRFELFERLERFERDERSEE
jgi:hypothetical protein